MTFRDTIAAIATPPGIGGIGLIRVSGPSAEGIARRLFRPSRPLAAFLSHHLYHGEIVSPETGAVLDDVLVAFMKGPHSYTGEDTLEISCHGGPLILRTVLDEVFRAGARPAERGEFTKRAFLNDRLDLSQAEAVLDLITAQTRDGLAAAAGRLKGNLSGRIEAIRERNHRPSGRHRSRHRLLRGGRRRGGARRRIRRTSGDHRRHHRPCGDLPAGPDLPGGGRHRDRRPAERREIVPPEPPPRREAGDRHPHPGNDAGLHRRGRRYRGDPRPSDRHRRDPAAGKRHRKGGDRPRLGTAGRRRRRPRPSGREHGADPG